MGIKEAPTLMGVPMKHVSLITVSFFVVMCWRRVDTMTD
jgi:hypothetical protein